MTLGVSRKKKVKMSVLEAGETDGGQRSTIGLNERLTSVEISNNLKNLNKYLNS
jgi:hypothetical protein